MTSVAKRRAVIIAMFSVVIVGFVWLGQDVRFVHQRRTMYAKLGPILCQKADASDEIEGENRSKNRAINAPLKAHSQAPIPNAKVTFIRQLCGDFEFDFVRVPLSDFCEARRLFPEAWVLADDERQASQPISD